MSDDVQKALAASIDEIQKLLAWRSGAITADEERVLRGAENLSLLRLALEANRIADALEERNRIATIEAQSSEQIAITLGALHDIYFHRSSS